MWPTKMDPFHSDGGWQVGKKAFLSSVDDIVTTTQRRFVLEEVPASDNPAQS